MSERPKVGIGVIIIKDNKLLMQKRKNSHGSGCWSFPGGHLEFNENIEDCAKRETLEETGVSIRNLRPGPFTNDLFKDDGKHYVTLYMIADYESGEARVMEPEKCDGVGWFEWGKLPEPLFTSIQNLIKLGFSPATSSLNNSKRDHPGDLARDS